MRSLVVIAAALLTVGVSAVGCSSDDTEPHDGSIDASDEVNAAEMPIAIADFDTVGRIRSFEAPGGLVWLGLTDDGPVAAFVFGWCPAEGVTYEGTDVATTCF